MNPFDVVPKDKWTKAYYDEKGDDGNGLCWFHNNRPGGCSGGFNGQCDWSHDKRPADYHGKHWADLSDDERKLIIAKVGKF